MIVKESERLTASEALNHPWFNLIKNDKISFIKLNFDESNFFKEYIEGVRLKKIILLYIASKLQEKEILYLKKLFKVFDEDNNGQIDYNEFEQSLLKSNSKEIKKEEIKKIFDEIDSNNNNKIDYTEFIAATLNKSIYLQKERLFDAFSAIDNNSDGKISKDEIMKILKLQPINFNIKFVDDIFNDVDINKDGLIDYKEFVEMMK